MSYANDHACFTPTSIEGVAAGIITNLNIRPYELPTHREYRLDYVSVTTIWMIVAITMTATCSSIHTHILKSNQYSHY